MVNRLKVISIWNANTDIIKKNDSAWITIQPKELCIFVASFLFSSWMLDIFREKIIVINWRKTLYDSIYITSF